MTSLVGHLLYRLLVQPSSGIAEQVFSLLGQTLADQQQNTLEDLVEASVNVAI
jgi:hypothetical protein